MKGDILIVLFVVFGLIAVVMLMKGPEEQTVEENVLFEVTNIFSYHRSENNLPIENLTLLFPCPNVDNQPPITASTWALYYVDNENVVYLQASEAQLYEFAGQRTENLKILSHGRVATEWGPKTQYVLDKLYQGEVLVIKTLANVPSSAASKVTIRNYGDALGRSSAYYWHPPEWRIDLSFSSQLSRGTDNLETFYNRVDNAPAGSVIWLYPI